ncbi:hypothetical protein [Paenirhodobacter sp.]|uniref:hypothetical protein n=1 Tax=Paenirhodobacter sp. TaxID=1965326 RepID=UPI003B3F1084
MANRTTHRTDATEGTEAPEVPPVTAAPETAAPAETVADDAAPDSTETGPWAEEPKDSTPAESEPADSDPKEPEPVTDPEPTPEPVKPEPEAAKPEPAAPVVVHKGPGAGALILGGVVAALIGGGATLYAIPHLPPQLAGWIQPPQPNTTAFDSALSAQGSRIDAVAASVEALKAAPAPAADLTGLQGALDANAADMRTLQESVKALADRITALESRPVAVVEGGAPVDSAAALQSQIDTLRAQLSGVGNVGDVQAQIAAAAAAVKSELESAQGQASQIGSAAEAAARRSLQQAAAARVAAALQAGVPLAPALADAEAAGLTVPDALKADVPGLSVLQSTFPEAARTALTASRKAAAGTGLGERLGAFLMAQTGARSLTPREGTDPDAVMSRAQAAVDDGDLPRAIQEIGALPQAGQALMSGWITQAQLRIAADQAVADLAQSVK